MNVRDSPFPSSTDLEYWRKAIKENRLRDYKLEVLVATLQDLGPEADRRVREPLAFRISDALMKMLRNRVGFNHPNDGRDIIDRVHADLLTALFDPTSADGKALRTAFSARVSFRIKDGIATEFKHARIPIDEQAWKAHDTVAETKDTIAVGAAEEGEATRAPIEGVSRNDDGNQVSSSNESVRTDSRLEPAEDTDSDDADFHAATIPETSLMDGVRDLHETIDNARILSIITDPRKRLAFRLHMDRIPIHSVSGPSIAKALGVDRKTVGNWIAEMQEQLSQNKEVILLESASSGERQ